MHIERMEQLRRVLVEVSLQHKSFKLSTWRMDNQCGTTCCALGWAAEDSWHQEQGLDRELIAVSHDETSQFYIPVYCDEDNQVYSGFPAAQYYFQIPFAMAEDLFSVLNYRPAYGFKDIRPEDVIAKLDKYLEAEKAKHPAKPAPASVPEPVAFEVQQKSSDLICLTRVVEPV